MIEDELYGLPLKENTMESRMPPVHPGGNFPGGYFKRNETVYYQDSRKPASEQETAFQVCE